MLNKLRSVFPVEILEMIIQQLPQDGIPPVLRVNSLFNAIAVRILYHAIPDLPAARSVACLRTLASNVTNAGYVHRLSIDWSGRQVIGNLLRLLQRALKQLKSLQHLSLELSPHDNQFSLAWVFVDVPFSLRTLATSARCDTLLASFLETQPLLHELCLRGFQTTSPFVLSHSALPRLTSFRTIHAGVPVLSQVMRGRPIEAVSVSLFAEDGFAPLDTLRLSSIPLKRLTIMSLVEAQPHKLLYEIAERMPQLEALHVVVLLAHYNHQILLDFAPMLSKFTQLRYITFMAGLGASFDDEHEIAALWHQSCPTLKTIILPKGQVWFERDGHWTCCV